VSIPKTITISGIALSVDETGFVNISEVAGSCRNGNKSPAEWARTARARKLFRTLESQRGLAREAVWDVRGGRRGACTWAIPEVAEAYVDDLDTGKYSPKALLEQILSLEERVKALEECIL